MGPLETRFFPLPPADRREILRYAGAKTADSDLLSLLEETLSEAEPLLSPKVCLRTLPVSAEDDRVDLGFTAVTSKNLSQTLGGCSRAVVFAATLGIGPDRLMARYGHTAPAKALLLQAIGTERIEALCDCLCRELQDQAEVQTMHITHRFSPGYGDLPLSFQRELFRILDCSRTIGLTLNDSLLMSPSKSVTAIVGISPGCPELPENQCTYCDKFDCIHRRSL